MYNLLVEIINPTWWRPKANIYTEIFYSAVIKATEGIFESIVSAAFSSNPVLFVTHCTPGMAAFKNTPLCL